MVGKVHAKAVEYVKVVAGGNGGGGNGRFKSSGISDIGGGSNGGGGNGRSKTVE